MSSPLETSALSFRYAHTSKPVLTDVNLRVSPGESVAVVGDSGSGKSTLLRCLCGAIPHVYAGKLTGRVLIAQKPSIRLRLPRIAAIVGYVFQEPESQLFCASVEDEIAFGPENLRVPPDQIGTRVEQLLTHFTLAHLRTRDPLTLSGGEKQRVAIAAVLAMQPRVLLLDEPTAHLDDTGREALRAALDQHRARGGAVVVAATDAPYHLGGFTRVRRLSDGRLTEQKDVRAVR